MARELSEKVIGDFSLSQETEKFLQFPTLQPSRRRTAPSERSHPYSAEPIGFGIIKYTKRSIMQTMGKGFFTYVCAALFVER